MLRSFAVACALLGALVITSGVSAETAPAATPVATLAATPEPTPWSTPFPPLIPCEWYPKDRDDLGRGWWVPLEDASCPQMTLPPTDTL